MAINPYSSFLNPIHLDNIPNPILLDKFLKIKECVHDATKAFLEFCIYFIEPYLENDLLQPHLQNINQLCIHETDSYLEVHLANIYTILEKDPTLLEVYMTIIQDLKDVPSDLLELDQISDNPSLIKKHFQMIQYIKKLNSSSLLKMHLWTIKKLQNNSNIELYLKSMSILYNFQSQLLKTYLLTSSLICYLEPLILEIHLKNMNSTETSFLKNYINTLCDIKDDLELVKLYIHAIFIIKKKSQFARNSSMEYPEHLQISITPFRSLFGKYFTIRREGNFIRTLYKKHLQCHSYTKRPALRVSF
ncbi:MAG: hypothetical protein ACRDAI_05620 [Candidatus Rhabdochlamydia sp.]